MKIKLQYELEIEKYALPLYETDKNKIDLREFTLCTSVVSLSCGASYGCSMGLGGEMTGRYDVNPGESKDGLVLFYGVICTSYKRRYSTSLI